MSQFYKTMEWNSDNIKKHLFPPWGYLASYTFNKSDVFATRHLWCSKLSKFYRFYSSTNVWKNVVGIFQILPIFWLDFKQDHHPLLPSISGKIQMQLQLHCIFMSLMDAGVNNAPPTSLEYTKETQGRTANKEKMRRLNIGSGFWSVPCAEEETTGTFGGRWCHRSPSVSVSWGDQNSRVSWEVREGSPMLPKWVEGSGFPDLCYIHACQGEALLKLMTT